MRDEVLKERFNAKWKKDENTGCWVWTASTAGRGYGQIKLPGTRKQIYAHRLSYEIHKGECPKDRQVLHSCDNPACVNPDHLSLGTCKDNLQDMKKKGRHLYGEKNASAKLTEKDVIDMHKLNAMGWSQTKISNSFGVHQVTVGKILNGKRWAHIKNQIENSKEI